MMAITSEEKKSDGGVPIPTSMVLREKGKKNEMKIIIIKPMT